jgi:transposase
MAETLGQMNGFFWFTRVPETLSLARDLIHEVAPDLMPDVKQTAFRSLGTVYAGVRQRWVVVYSPEAYQRALKTVDQHSLKQSTAELKAFELLCRQDFAGEADARQSWGAFEKGLKFTFIAEARVIAVPRYQGKNRPVRGRQPDCYVYRLAGGLASLPAHRWQRLQQQSCFILATSQLDSTALSDEALIAAYKDQQKVERGFRFLKDPMFMASSLYLKSPERLMALMMVMTLCLLVYAALEYRIRQSLKEHSQTFPNQKGEPVANPTARWVFQFFAGIPVLAIAQVQVLVLNMNQYHTALLKLLP